MASTGMNKNWQMLVTNLLDVGVVSRHSSMVGSVEKNKSGSTVLVQKMNMYKKGLSEGSVKPNRPKNPRKRSSIARSRSPATIVATTRDLTVFVRWTQKAFSFFCLKNGATNRPKKIVVYMKTSAPMVWLIS